MEWKKRVRERMHGMEEESEGENAWNGTKRVRERMNGMEEESVGENEWNGTGE